MLDFLRNLRKSESEKRQEELTAYLDGILTPKERERFEQQLAADATLQADMERQRVVKTHLQQLPRMRAPRHFTLDPAIYGRPQVDLAFRLYPALRTATVLATVLFISLLALDLLAGVGGPVDRVAEAPAAGVAIQAEGEPEQATGAVALEAQAEEMVEEAEAVVEVTVEFEVAEEPVEEPPEAEAAAEMAPVEPSVSEALGTLAPAKTATPAGAEFYAAPLEEGAEDRQSVETPAQAPAPTGVARDEALSTSVPERIEAEAAETVSESVAGSTELQPTLTVEATSAARGEAVAESAGARETVEVETGAPSTDGIRSLVSPIRVIEFALGLGVLALVVATLLLRRRR